MNSGFNVLMISSRGPEETVFESQVLDIVRAWRTYGNVSLLYRSRFPKEVQVDGATINRISRMVPELCRFLLYCERILNSQWSCNISYNLVHCRGAVGAWQILHCMNKKQRNTVKVLYDCRGITVEEMEGSWSSSWKKVFLPLKLHELRKIEKYVVNKVDMLTAVSDGLSNYLEHNYGRKADCIVRPVINTDKFFFSNSCRSAIRKLLGIDPKGILFIFVGGGDYWQNLDLLKKWWCNVRQSNFTMLILSHTPSYYDDWVKSSSSSVGRIIVRTVPHKEVSSYMSAADFGILFREKSLVNNLASPVKLIEYLCTGLQVLTNLHVYQLIQPYDIQITNLTNLEPINEFSIRDDAVREIRSHINLERFSADNTVKGIYDFLNSKS